MEMTYLSQPPKRWTFEQPKLKEWVESHCHGKVLNLFAGKTRLAVDEYRVDVSNENNPDCVADAFEFVTTTSMKFDTVVLDPPYNLRKSREKYGENRWIGAFTKIKDHLVSILNPGATVVILGYDTVGMSKSRGFEKVAVCVVCHNGDHNDTLVVVERLE